MARGFRIDLGKLGERLPERLQRAGRRVAASAEKPVVVAEAVAFPEQLLEPLSDRAVNPLVARRLRRCTIETRAHVLGRAGSTAASSGISTSTPATRA